MTCTDGIVATARKEVGRGAAEPSTQGICSWGFLTPSDVDVQSLGVMIGRLGRVGFSGVGSAATTARLCAVACLQRQKHNLLFCLRRAAAAGGHGGGIGATGLDPTAA